MKRIALYFLLFIVVGAVVYGLGPKPAAPKLALVKFTVPSNLMVLEKQINADERATRGIKPGCEAKIVWADSSKKMKTKYAFLYIHGFGASEMEADPVHRDIGKKYRANLYLARLPGHGINLGDATMSNLTADDFVYSIEHALAITKALGENVIVISNSFGGALSLWLTSVHPEIKALILYSPCVEAFDKRMEIFTKPWGMQFVKLGAGSLIFDYKPVNKMHSKYWTTHYHLNGLAAFQSFLDHTTKKATFEKIKCPTLMVYSEKDTAASVPAMLKMFGELSSPHKQRFVFSRSTLHEICTPIFSNDFELVEVETEKFLDGVL